jgi:hypothetical protein
VHQFSKTDRPIEVQKINDQDSMINNNTHDYKLYTCKIIYTFTIYPKTRRDEIQFITNKTLNLIYQKHNRK